jgi:5'-nucleotidase
VFSNLIGARGKDVLYIGDHIFGDILKSKKTRGWRTFLVVPEMTQELYVWTAKRHLVDDLQALEQQLSEAYLNMDSTSTVAPDTTDIRNQIQVK